MYPSVVIANRALAISQAKVRGHEIVLVCTFMDMSDKDVHAKCRCGWRSPDCSANAHAARLGVEHVDEYKWSNQ